MTTAIVVAQRSIELPEAIEFQFADSLTCARFYNQHHKELDARQRKVVDLAYIRASFREGRDLLLSQFAKLCNTSEAHAAHYLRKYTSISLGPDTRIDNNLAMRAMVRMTEADVA